MLSTIERGMAARVCGEWRTLMRVPTLWTDIDTAILPRCAESHVHNATCFAAQRHRSCRFLEYVGNIRAIMHRMRINGDIWESEWRETIEAFITRVRLHELTTAHIDWAVGDAIDVVEANERVRRAQRHFVTLFDTFTRVAPKLTTLIVPFDWSDRSVQHLCRLSYLSTLVLKKYFTYQCLSQSTLDCIIDGLPALRRLHLEVWIASGNGSVSFTLASPHLELLDLSHCRGFDLAHIDLPALTTIKLSRIYLWHGTLMLRSGNGSSGPDTSRPCIREILANGAPNLRVINEHILRPEWKDRSVTYDELELVLGAVCSCVNHRLDVWAP